MITPLIKEHQLDMNQLIHQLGTNQMAPLPRTNQMAPLSGNESNEVPLLGLVPLYAAAGNESNGAVAEDGATLQ